MKKRKNVFNDEGNCTFYIIKNGHGEDKSFEIYFSLSGYGDNCNPRKRNGLKNFELISERIQILKNIETIQITDIQLLPFTPPSEAGIAYENIFKSQIFRLENEYFRDFGFLRDNVQIFREIR